MNPNLFPTRNVAPTATARNDAGGNACAFGPRHQLAQFAATGCLNGTFYAGAAINGSAPASANSPHWRMW